MATAAEAALGRRLFAFHLEAAPLPLCATGAGPCAVWEAASGRVVMDSGLAARVAGAAGGPAALAQPGMAAGDGGESGGLLAAFVGKLAEQLEQATALMRSGQVGACCWELGMLCAV